MSFLHRVARALSFTWDSRTFDDWRRTWDAREAALTELFGLPDPHVVHSPTPLDRGGRADVLSFRGYVPGVTYVTADLTGSPDYPLGQVDSALGMYEIMMCTRDPAPWPAPGLALIAQYSLDNAIDPGHTMNVGSIADSALEHLIFTTPDLGGKRFEFLGQRYGLLLSIGITDSELRFAKSEGSDTLLSRLRAAGVFPYTDPGRPTVA